MMYSVLVIDDDASVRTSLSTILENEGYFVETAEKGKEAIKACKKFPADVALIDIKLPDMQGTDLIKELKAIRPKIVNIILTGNPSLDNAIKSVNEKADGYIVKPFNPDELLTTIKQLLNDKTQFYVDIIKEVEVEKANSPKFRYQNPERWNGP